MKDIIKIAKSWKKVFKEQAERHERVAKDNRDMEEICENLIKKEKKNVKS